MNREIKFKAWDKEEKKFHQVFPKWKLDSYGYFECIPEERFEVMQYTGLKDKNGKEIYEGDIVRNGNEVSEVKFGIYNWKVRLIP